MDLKEGVRGALSAGTRKPPGMGCAGAWQVGRCPRNLRRAREGQGPPGWEDWEARGCDLVGDAAATNRAPPRPRPLHLSTGRGA